MEAKYFIHIYLDDDGSSSVVVVCVFANISVYSVW